MRSRPRVRRSNWRASSVRRGASSTPRSCSGGVLRATRGRRLLVEARLERAAGRSGRAKIQQAVDLLSEGEPYMLLLAQLDATHDMPAHDAAALCAGLQARAEEIEHFGVATKVQLLRANHLLRAGEAQAAAAAFHSAQPFDGAVGPWDMYLPEAWWIGFQIFDAAEQPSAALAALRSAVAWINDNALPEVPPEFQDGFLNRNAINRSILTTAGRRLHR
jgi:hypothetical protein